MEPKVSILIPVYNVEKYLKRCLDSCINQTLKNIEIICVNDGSTDNSLAVLNDYANNDSRIKIISKKNGGLPSSRNVGMDHAHGKYIMYLDADDYIELNACEELFDKAEQENATAIIYGGLIEPESKITDWTNSTLLPPDMVFENLSIENFLKYPFMYPFIWRNFILRDHIEKNHFRLDEQVVIGEDLAFQFKVLPGAKKVISTSKCYYHYDCSRVGSLTNNKNYNNVSSRMKSHIFLVEKTAEVLKKKNLSVSEENCFFNWTIDFIYWTFAQVNTNEKAHFAEQIKVLFERLGILSCLDRLNPKFVEEYNIINGWMDYKSNNDSNKLITFFVNLYLEPNFIAFDNLVNEVKKIKDYCQMEVFMHYYSPFNFIELEKYCLKYDFINFNKIDDYNEYLCFNSRIKAVNTPYISFLKYEDTIPYGIDVIEKTLKEKHDVIVTCGGIGFNPMVFTNIPLSNFIVNKNFLIEHDISFKKRGTMAAISFKLDLLNSTDDIVFSSPFVVSALEGLQYKNELEPKEEYLDCLLDIIHYYETTKNIDYRNLVAKFANNGDFIRMIVSDAFGWNIEAAEHVNHIFEKILLIANSGCVPSSTSVNRLLLNFIRNRHTLMSGLVRFQVEENANSKNK